MPRAISTDFRDAVEASRSSEVIVIFATITHASLAEPVRVNSDVVDYEYNGDLYSGAAFALTLLTDDEQPPRAQVSIHNVAQALGRAVQALSSSPAILIEIMVKSDFDDSDPRVAIGTPVVEYSAPGLLLQNVKCDVLTMSADIVGYDLTTEPWPSIRSPPA